MRASFTRAVRRRGTVLRRSVVIAAVTLVVPVAVATSASPARASYADEYTDSNGRTNLLYYAEMFDSDFGKDNRVGMSGGQGTSFTITESTPGMTVAVGPGCSAVARAPSRSSAQIRA